MKFPVYFICGYRSYLESNLSWSSDELTAMRLVKAIKGRHFENSSQIGSVLINSTPAGRNSAFELAAKMAAKKLSDHGHFGNLVAVPSSGHVAFDEPFTGSILTDAIAREDQRFTSRPVLTFTSVQPKSSKSNGSRDPNFIAANLKASDQIDFDTCILVDDVKSSGGHLIGAARYLSSIGVRVEAAFCVAETVMSRPENMFNIPNAVIDATPDAWDF